MIFNLIKESDTNTSKEISANSIEDFMAISKRYKCRISITMNATHSSIPRIIVHDKKKIIRKVV